MEIKTPNGTVGEAFAAMLILITNPLSYRGYLYAPMAGYSYYLGSRFYAPTLCRFMNADVYADTAQGVVGTNMFAYCNNNPINLIDPDGTLTFTLFGVSVSATTVVGIVVILVTAVAMALLVAQIANILAENMPIFTATQITDTLNLYPELKAKLDKHFKESLKILSSTVYALLTNLIVDSVNSIRNYYSGEAVHHIVAKIDSRANHSRLVLKTVGINVNDSCNLVLLKKTLHVCLHTSMYHFVVDYVVTYFYNSSATKNSVEEALKLIELVLVVANDTVGGKG